VANNNTYLRKHPYKSSGHVGLFDKEETSSKLSKLGNPLERLHKVIDFEMFRPKLELSLLNHDRKSNSGCKRYDVVLMFKIIFTLAPPDSCGRKGLSGLSIWFTICAAMSRLFG
jgi:hypothetical protein